jgi:hypothetical protein
VYAACALPDINMAAGTANRQKPDFFIVDLSFK